MKPLGPVEAATLYLHAVDGETVKQIATRQGVTPRAVSGTLQRTCEKCDATTIAQAALRAYLSGQLESADRTYNPRAARAEAERQLVDRERRKQRAKHTRRGLNYEAPAPDEDDS